MNKRQKKKRALQSQVNFLIAENALLIEAQKNGVRERKLLGQRLTELEKTVSVNALASNERFGAVESANGKLRVDLDRAILEFKHKKKSWFGK